MSRNKILFGMGLAIYLLPVLAIADQAMIEDVWSLSDLSRIGSVQKVNNDQFIIKGAIPNDCLRQEVKVGEGFQILFDSSNGQITIQDPMPSDEELKGGKISVRDCLKKSRPACRRSTCTKLSDLNGRFDFSGVDNDINLSLVVSEEQIVSLEGMSHVSQKTLRANARAETIKNLTSAKDNCTGQDRLNAATTLLRMGAITASEMDKIRDKSVEDEFKRLEKAAKLAKGEDRDTAIENLINFSTEHDVKFANRAVLACAAIAGSHMSEKTRDSYDKAEEVFNQCEAIDGISSINSKRLKDYKIGLVYDRLALSINNPNQFMSEMADAQRLIQEQYESACATDGGDPDMCTRLMGLNDKIETLGYRAQENAMRAQQRKMAEYQARQQRMMNPSAMNFGGPGMPINFNSSPSPYGILGPQQYGANSVLGMGGTGRF
ncbi:MAG: hypothetical protein AABZ55_04520 [Bdellovibrionota bacterium]